ncbi:hypothetical protein YEP4_15447 [Yersinia enterocolitica subsp. palearctica YE-P4]|uniref:Uncharacterized protein n=2 Tax=Yersinia enterocolitica TaxID=630 RepID=A0A0H3NZG2_YERE1|nr:hypothetical protein IOK_06849 [Yersinia enterocolitica subsp. palearctica PhRBD_Ye1]EOR66795.1 hypothetical protein YE149_15549 [Yersinia enterocolitica subsp. palearctica YE-149]EOR74280.1 hypothetical protein YE150_15485 [Yersinia enterocolitica subsp. palearctica YE-150]EOR74933.1 hypothetical protein YEP1_15544 [Yersinia enterocolitica subsp. palearctica YE-P1]EOR78055.1 hypothetical protein YEP4_15447 [Yersinia enterocolitica subsp. palearctica YE-P4]CBX73114.1 unknown protein [Yersin
MGGNPLDNEEINLLAESFVIALYCVVLNPTIMIGLANG